MDSIQVSLLKSPTFHSYDRSSIIAFLHHWERYLSNVASINASHPDSKPYVVRNILDVIEPSILYTIVVFDLDLNDHYSPLLMMYC
jgi:hypothetical protein